MKRQVFSGGWYADSTPSGSFVVLFPGSHLLTHLGIIPLPPGEPWGIGYVRCTDVWGFKFAGQAHSTLSQACWEWLPDSSYWMPYPPPCVGVSPVIYGLDGVLHRSDGSVGSQGYRYAAADGTLVSGDATYGPFHGLSEYSAAGDLWLGQGHDAGGVLVWDGTVLRLLEAGDGRFIRVQVDGERVSVAWMASIGAVVVQTTLAELRALPPVVTPQPTPEPPTPPAPHPAPPRPVPVPPAPTPHPQPPQESKMLAYAPPVPGFLPGDVVDNGNGTISIKKPNGTFLCVTPDGHLEERDSPGGAWESFRRGKTALIAERDGGTRGPLVYVLPVAE